jgi:menaquinone-9 beta-reductase
VVVVGAGPGGAAAAHFLSVHGLDVLLLDRAEFPRDKTCGDGLTPRALRVLRDMGLLDEVVQRGCRVDAYEVVAPDFRATTAAITASPGALVIPRYKLDEMIARHAVQSGARFESGVNVNRVEPVGTHATVHAEDGRVFQAKVAVIATGAATGVLTRSGILHDKPRHMLAIRAYFADIQHEVARKFQLRLDGAPMPGYGWIFPVDSSVANVGVAFMPRRRSPPASVAFTRFTQGSAVAQMLEGSRRVEPVKGYPIRTDFLRAPTCAERTLLVGEAAGLVNPLSGEGIDYALESGRMAARHLLALFQEGDLSTERLAEYHALLHARFHNLFQFGEWIRDWYGHPLLINILVVLANRHPELRQLLANIVLGEREPRGYRPATMLARLLIYLASRQLSAISRQLPMHKRGGTTRDD